MPASRTITIRSSQSATGQPVPSSPEPRVRMSPPRLIAALSKRAQSLSASQPLPTPPRSIAQPAAMRAHPVPTSSTSGKAGTPLAGGLLIGGFGRRWTSVIVRSYPASSKAGRQAAFTRPSLRVYASRLDAEQFGEEWETGDGGACCRVETRKIASRVESRERCSNAYVSVTAAEMSSSVRHHMR